MNHALRVAPIIAAVILSSCGKSQVAPVLQPRNASVTTDPGPSYKVGSSTVDITPDTALELFGYSDGRRYASPVKKSNDVPNTTLSARALAISDLKEGGGTVVLMNVDMAGMDLNDVQWVKDNNESGIPADRIVINFSHTHTAPVYAKFGVWDPNAQWVLQLRSKLVEAIKKAVVAQRKSNLYLRRSHFDLAENRRDAKFGYDQSLDILKVVDFEQKETTAIAFFYGAHPVSLGESPQYENDPLEEYPACEPDPTGVGPPCPGDSAYYYSADYPGVARLGIESEHPSVMAMFVQGCGGDVNPPIGNYQTMKAVGARLAKAVNFELTATEGWELLSGNIDARTITANLDLEVSPLYVPSVFQAIKIGPWTLVALPHEAVTEWAALVRRYWSTIWPDELVTVLGYSGTVRSYLPTGAMVAGDGDPDDNTHGGANQYEGGWSFGPLAYAWGTIYQPNPATGDDLDKQVTSAIRELAVAFEPAPSPKSLWLKNGAYVEVKPDDTNAFNLTGLVTLEAWINSAATSRQQGIVERYSADGGGYGLRIAADGRLQFFTCISGNRCTTVSGRTTVPPNSWHHAAGVFDGTKLRVFLDGLEDGAMSSSQAPGAGTASLKIGARGDDATCGFLGCWRS